MVRIEAEIREAIAEDTRKIKEAISKYKDTETSSRFVIHRSALIWSLNEEFVNGSPCPCDDCEVKIANLVSMECPLIGKVQCKRYLQWRNKQTEYLEWKKEIEKKR